MFAQERVEPLGDLRRADAGASGTGRGGGRMRARPGRGGADVSCSMGAVLAAESNGTAFDSREELRTVGVRPGKTDRFGASHLPEPPSGGRMPGNSGLPALEPAHYTLGWGWVHSHGETARHRSRRPHAARGSVREAPRAGM